MTELAPAIATTVDAAARDRPEACLPRDRPACPFDRRFGALPGTHDILGSAGSSGVGSASGGATADLASNGTIALSTSTVRGDLRSTGGRVTQSSSTVTGNVTAGGTFANSGGPWKVPRPGIALSGGGNAHVAKDRAFGWWARRPGQSERRSTPVAGIKGPAARDGSARPACVMGTAHDRRGPMDRPDAGRAGGREGAAGAARRLRRGPSGPCASTSC